MFHVAYKYAEFSILCFEYTKKLLYLLRELSLFCVDILLLVWRHGSEWEFVCGELQELCRDVLWHGKLHGGGVA